MQLAEAVDINRTHMSNIESPDIDTSVSLETLLDIALELDVSVTALFGIKNI